MNKVHLLEKQIIDLIKNSKNSWYVSRRPRQAPPITHLSGPFPQMQTRRAGPSSLFLLHVYMSSF